MMDSTGLSVADALALSRDGNNDGMFGGDGAWVFFLFFLLAWGGNWGNNGFGGCAGSGALTRADLCQDMNFQGMENGIRGIANGICDSTFALNNTMTNGFAQVQNTLTSQFAGVDNAVCTLGYQNAQLINGLDKSMLQGFNGVQAGQTALGNQIAQCCCTTQQNIKDGITQGVMNTNAIQQQIQQCCCDNEKATMQTRYDMATQNCATLQAIDKLGDRIIDYMTATERQNLRDENFALRLSASQQAQNNLLINELRPTARPAYITCSPYESAFGRCGNVYGNSCGCGTGC